MRFSGFLVTRTVIVGAVVALAATACSSSQAATIDTHSAWNGADKVGKFGCPTNLDSGASAYGQTVKIPANKNHLTRFTVFMQDWFSSGSMVVRGEVYAWDPSTHMATGPAVGESSAQTVTSGESGFLRKSFVVDAKVQPGHHYVVFASIDKDYADCAPGYMVGWAAVDDTAYDEGTFVSQQGHGDASAWTTEAWDEGHADLAITMFMTG